MSKETDNDFTGRIDDIVEQVGRVDFSTIPWLPPADNNGMYTLTRSQLAQVMAHQFFKGSARGVGSIVETLQSVNRRSDLDESFVRITGRLGQSLTDQYNGMVSELHRDATSAGRPFNPDADNDDDE